jgi:NADPH-dependent curcumin reductase CurA
MQVDVADRPSVQLETYPVGPVAPTHFRVVDLPVRDPGPGEVLVRNRWTSVDPGMRLRLSEAAPAGYFARFALRRPMDGIMTVGEVIDSRAAGFAVGDVVSHALGWRDYAVVQAGRRPSAVSAPSPGSTPGWRLRSTSSVRSAAWG